MLMIEPRPFAHMAGPNSWQGTRTPPTRFKSKFATQSSTAICSIDRSGVTVTFGSFPPAALRRIVGTPKTFRSSSCAVFKLSRFETSAEKNCAAPPLLRISATRASPRSALRPRIATRAPAFARPSAIAPPSTPVAPITTATSFERSNNCIARLAGLRWRRLRLLPLSLRRLHDTHRNRITQLQNFIHQHFDVISARLLEFHLPQHRHVRRVVHRILQAKFQFALANHRRLVRPDQPHRLRELPNPRRPAIEHTQLERHHRKLRHV